MITKQHEVLKESFKVQNTFQNHSQRLDLSLIKKLSFSSSSRLVLSLTTSTLKRNSQKFSSSLILLSSIYTILKLD